MAQMTAQQAAAQNLAFRQQTLARGVPMRQRIFSQTFSNYTAGQALTLNVPLHNVGLTKRLVIQFTATVGVGAAETQTRTAWGPANVFSNLTFNDYSNYQRVNTTGWHAHSVATVKNRAVFGGAFTTDTPTGFGSTVPVITCPSSYTTTGTVQMVYQVPFAYSDTDLTGAVLSNVVGANAYMQMTINPNFFVSSTGNSVQAVFQSSTSQLGTITSYTVVIWQEYIDNLPQDPQTGAYMVPAIDLSMVYGLYNTQMTGLAQNADNPYNYTNYRRFLSTTCIYDNNGVLSTTGADLNYIRLVSANMSQMTDDTPLMLKLRERMEIMDNFPIGSYYISTRERPIDTVQNGNVQLIFNPANVAASGAQVLLGVEYLALLNQVAQAGSVLAGG